LSQRSLTDMRDEVRRFSDTESKTIRHPSATLTQMLNESLTRLREMVSRNGHSYYVNATPYVSAVDIGTPYQDEILGDAAIGAKHGRLFALLLKDGDEYWQLDEFTDAELAFWKSQPQGRPVVFRIRGRTDTGGGEIEIELYPAPDRAYVSEAIFLLEHTPLVADEDLFDDPFAWSEWACADAAQKVCLKDNDRDRFAMLAQKKTEIEAEIERAAPKHQRVRVTRRRDTRSHRIRDNLAGAKFR
jgi:hypothetical protein